MKRTCITVVTAALMGIMVSHAGAFDLTGTWKGKMACRYFDGTRGLEIYTGTLDITQDGTAINMRDNIFNAYYAGRAIFDLTNQNQGEVNFVDCETTTDPTDLGEIGRAHVSVKPGTGGGRFSATSIYYDDDEIDTCTWIYRRIRTTDPKILGCPEGAVSGGILESTKHMR